MTCVLERMANYENTSSTRCTRSQLRTVGTRRAPRNRRPGLDANRCPPRVPSQDQRNHTAKQMFTWGSQRFEIGKDYPVLKADAKSLTVMMHDKKGHEVKERLDVTGAEEK